MQNLFFGEIRVDENGYLLADDGRTVLDPPRKAEEVYEVWDDSQLADMDYTRAWTVIRNRVFEDRPYADITATVSAPGYLGHLAAGMRWSSTAHGYF